MSGQKRSPIETGMMCLAAVRTEAAHDPRGQFVVWTGRSRIGKTTTAQWLATRFTVDYDAGVDGAFNAKHYTTASIDPYTGNVQKQTLASVFQATLGALDPRHYRALKPPRLAEMTVEGLRQQGTQMVFIDEAGGLCHQALEALTLLLNMAGTGPTPHPLTLVLVGMQDLPTKVEALPQIKNRVADTVLFRPYERTEVINVLAQAHPYFAALNPSSEEEKAVYDFVMREDISEGGLVGLILQLVDRADRLAMMRGKPFGLSILRTAHLIKAEDHELAKRDAEAGYSGPMPRAQTSEPRPAPTRRSGKSGRVGRRAATSGGI